MDMDKVHPYQTYENFLRVDTSPNKTIILRKSFFPEEVQKGIFPKDGSEKITKCVTKIQYFCPKRDGKSERNFIVTLRITPFNPKEHQTLSLFSKLVIKSKRVEEPEVLPTDSIVVFASPGLFGPLDFWGELRKHSLLLDRD